MLRGAISVPEAARVDELAPLAPLLYIHVAILSVPEQICALSLLTLQCDEVFDPADVRVKIFLLDGIPSMVRQR